jgi:hypothetical protein
MVMVFDSSASTSPCGDGIELDQEKPTITTVNVDNGF